MKPKLPSHRLLWCLGTILGGVMVPVQAQEFRATWADAFHAGYKSAAEIDTMVSRAVTGRYNAIIAEVLAYHDTRGGGHGAYWNSSIVPKALDISGNDPRTGQPIDPLSYLCYKAHQSGIEVHAWLVTYRSCTVWPPQNNPLITAHPEWISVASAGNGGGPSQVGGAYILDAGSPDVQDYIVSVVRELVTNYEIDGINWDYIRYTQTDGGYPADAAYTNSGLARYKRIYNTTSTPSVSNTNWSNFRRRTISELIRRCRAEIPSIPNPRQPLRHTADLICFGNAPASCGSFTSSDAYNLFQDWRLWMERGWLDAAIPMNYKEDHCGSEPTWYRNWVDRNVGCWKYNRHMFCGQATYLNSMANSVVQMQYCRTAGAHGMVNYSYTGTRNNGLVCDIGWTNDTTWFSYLASNFYTSPVPTPTMPWRDPATATEGTIWGRVTDWASGLPVDDATVSISGIPAEQTDGNGYYTITMVPATAQGTSRTVTVIKSGYPNAVHPGAIIRAGDIVRYDFSLDAPAPQMVLSTSTLNRNVELGNNLTSDTFTVRNLNSGLAPLNYTVTDNVNWLSVAPSQGVSTGETDTITVSYTVSGLSGGPHQGTITVADAAASNSPQTVTVTVNVTPPVAPGDLDADGDVDMDDFGIFQACMTMPGQGSPTGVCVNANLDGDNDVDWLDLPYFRGCMSGADVPADLNCLN